MGVSAPLESGAVNEVSRSGGRRYFRPAKDVLPEGHVVDPLVSWKHVKGREGGECVMSGDAGGGLFYSRRW